MFYTYAHYTPQGRLFYIGKGQGERAYQISKRNHYWKSVVAKHGRPIMQVLAEWRTNKEACEHEIFLIKCFRDLGYKLCNMTDGGEGSLGVVPWNKGILWSDEVKKKQGAANIGNRHWVGRKHTKETIQKQKTAKAKYRFIGTNKEGIVVTLIGKTAIKEAGFVPTHVYGCANGSKKPHKGYMWVKELLKDTKC